MKTALQSESIDGTWKIEPQDELKIFSSKSLTTLDKKIIIKGFDACCYKRLLVLWWMIRKNCLQKMRLQKIKMENIMENSLRKETENEGIE